MNLELVWSEYRASIKAFLYSRVADQADVDDLLQEILIKTYNNLHTLKSGSSVKSWLFQIASNVIIDFYRRRASTDARLRNLTAEDLWYTETEQGDVKQELTACIIPFINALPDDVSQLLAAIDINGRSQKEYAAEKGISYSTLKSRVQKGRQDLRGLFEQCCRFELDRRGNLADCDSKQGSCNNC